MTTVVRAELLKAAYAEPRLRQLFPWTGMGALRSVPSALAGRGRSMHQTLPLRPTPCGRGRCPHSLIRPDPNERP
ncbi:DUF6193 family natural product biosynthesis protein [Streptomyces sp. NPDC019890]|uniref:DUF6193 family natural product biosynthesis protein n=1 Tax=Streptomyces sp. NPDC019890 TaxID=3365064 RepID=UPI003850876C